MGIHQITPQRVVLDRIQRELTRVEQVVVNVMNRVGLACVSEARNNGSYIDQTGNLRSSIGYAVLINGVVSKVSSFPKVKDGGDGKVKGIKLIQEASTAYNKGIVLIVVAGMEYAAYVETRKNVLQSAEILAQRLVPSILKQLGFK